MNELSIDKCHLDPFEPEMTKSIWQGKYRWDNEKHPFDTFRRVVNAVYKNSSKRIHRENAYQAMCLGLWLPGGRILAGAGTSKRVTYMNCFVNGALDDSMEGIGEGLVNTMLTLQQSGGIGTDFSPLRPEGALLKRTHSRASGPLPFMHTWDAASKTIRSAGDRRGAMMGTMADTHPDLLKLLEAKQVPGALTQFNISILISDAFMEAVREGEDWMLYFNVEPFEDARPQSLKDLDFVDEDTGECQYVYSVHDARELWEKITRNTYEFSEPGVIFIDRVNELNNLWYCEDIRCTNPCGEQPLPPNGTCNLGHVNLARIVRAPFTPAAHIDFELLNHITAIGVRFLDNVIDVTQYPLEHQREEEYQKRRLGLGFTGLADMLAQLGIRYGSPEAVSVTEKVTQAICIQAYSTSVELARELGAFPMFKSKEYLGGQNFAAIRLPEWLKNDIKVYGIRNSLLLTVAPTGTGSILYGNVSSGGEPVFLHKIERKVLRSDSMMQEKWDTFVEYGYGARLYASIHGTDTPLPKYMVTTEDLTVQDHVVMQAAAQRWIDSSMSKTINVPEEQTYEEFAKVYDLAYSLGCKGCTTYRPNAVRGSILSKPSDSSSTNPSDTFKWVLKDRPARLEGCTYKIKWPSLASALYLTVNHDPETLQPFEIFMASKDARYHDWMTVTTTMITSIFRRGDDIEFVARELQQVQSLNDSAFVEGKHHASLPAYIGYKLDQHIFSLRNTDASVPNNEPADKTPSIATPKPIGTRCPQCSQLTLVHTEGCKACTSCGFSSCA